MYTQKNKNADLDHVGLLHKKISIEQGMELLNSGSTLSARYNRTAHDLRLSTAGDNPVYSWKGLTDKAPTYMDAEETAAVIASHLWVVDPY